MNDLDIRISALVKEYNKQLLEVSNHAATLAAELASETAKRKEAEDSLAKLTEKAEEKAE